MRDQPPGPRQDPIYGVTLMQLCVLAQSSGKAKAISLGTSYIKARRVGRQLGVDVRVCKTFLWSEASSKWEKLNNPVEVAWGKIWKNAN